MNKIHFLTGGIGMLVGVLLTLGLTGGNAPETGGEGDETLGNRVTRLTRDNASLRQEVERLQDQVAAAESRTARPGAGTSRTEAEAVPESPTLPQTPGELGTTVGSLKKRWEAFREAFPDGRPGADDPRYQEFLTSFQALASESVMIGMQLRDVRDYDPATFGEFQGAMMKEYLGVDEATQTALQGTYADLMAQMKTNQLDWESRPQEREKMGEWFRAREDFEKQASAIILEDLPPAYHESYQKGFGDHPISGAMRGMMRGMGGMMGGMGRRGQEPPPGNEPPPPPPAP